MATKVYLSGDVVVVDKLGFPPVVNILVTQCKYQLIAVIEHENAEVIDYKDISIIDYVNNIVITDLVTDIQDVGGVPIGNLNEVIKYLSGFINIGDFNIVEQEQGGGGGGSGEANTGSNVGAGDGVFKQKTGIDLEFKTLIGGTGVTITNNANDLTISASSVAGHQPIIDLTSTDTSTTIIQATPTVLSWDVERAKDSGLTHDNITNNSRIVVDDNGTYQILGNIRMFSTAQRCQFVARVLIDGVIQTQPYGSGYIRNNGTSSDYWSCVVTPPPIKLTAGQYVEIQIQVESQTTTAITGTFQGPDSSFSIINLTGEKGDTGSQGPAGAVNTASNVGTGDGVFKQLTLADLEFKSLIGGANVTITNNANDLTISASGGAGVQFYEQADNETSSVSHSASTGTPTDVPNLSITAAETGSYIIYGSVMFDNLNLDNSGIEIAFAINGTTTVLPWCVSPMAKKKKYNGSQGTWGSVPLTAGDIVTLRMSTGGSSADLYDRKLYIATWK